MAISPLSAAKSVSLFSGYSLTNLAIQKILYIAHMTYMGDNNGKPLLNEKFQAWDYGPVLPSVYHKLKVFGNEPVRDVFHSVSDVGEPAAVNHLRAVTQKLSDKQPGDLVNITHWENGAWAKHYVPGARCIEIPDEDIAQELEERKRDRTTA